MTTNNVLIKTHSYGFCRWDGVYQKWEENADILVGESFALFMSTPIIPFNLTSVSDYNPGNVTFKNSINRLYYPINTDTNCSSLFRNSAGTNSLLIKTHSSGFCRWNGVEQSWEESKSILIRESFELYIQSTPIVPFVL